VTRVSPAVTVLPTAEGGRYPHGHSLLVRGRAETVLIDPSLTVSAQPPDGIDRVFVSHCHEDHVAGLWRFPHASIHVHEQDHIGLHSLDGLMTIYGLPADVDAQWRRDVTEKFSYVARPDARPFADGQAWDLGGVTIRAVHLPGHTRGHCGFFIEPDAVMFLADVDLTGFGPYYGDAWSSLDDWDLTLARCGDIEAVAYVTFHHKGVIEGRDRFLALLAEYAAVIEHRERALLEYLREPRTLNDLVRHRFVYRPHVTLLFADAVERRSAELHLERLVRRGAVEQLEADRYRAHVG
jgi:hydroxyacylglutathione hydrolase